MENRSFRLVIICCLFLGIAQILQARGHDTATKTINEVYEVNADVRIEINNKFGRVHINTWDKNTVELAIEMKGIDKSKEKAQGRLDEVDVAIIASPDLLSFETNLFCKGKKGNIKVAEYRRTEVNYTLSIPATTHLNIENQFGDTFIADMDGSVTLVLKHGHLKAEQMKHPDNNLKVRFGNIDMTSMAGGTIDQQHGKLDIESGINLVVKNRFSDVEIGRVLDLDADVRWGKLELQAVNNLKCHSQFGGVRIDTLYESLDCEIKHGDKLKVEYIPRSFQFVSIDGDFTKTKLYFAEGAEFMLDASTSFADISYPEEKANIQRIEKGQFNMKEAVKVNFGETNNKKVTVTLSYGDLDIDFK